MKDANGKEILIDELVKKILKDNLRPDTILSDAQIGQFVLRHRSQIVSSAVEAAEQAIWYYASEENIFGDHS